MSALVDPTSLREELADHSRPGPLVLDVQFTLSGDGPDLYAAGHLPGAPFVDLDAVLAGEPGAGGRHPLPEPGVLQSGLRAAGVHNDSRVVVYDQATSLAAARAWWVLRWAGLTDVRVLDGGLAGWQAAGGAVSTEPTSPTAGSVTVRPGSVPVLEAQDVATLTRAGVLVDARTPERYRGESEPIDPVAGHVPGAVNIPMGELTTGEGRLRSPEELRERFAAEDIDASTVVGSYCGSGVTAAHTALTLHEIGIEAAVYVGSWSHWVTDPGRPVATGD
ncbi:sulfurtransferase [Janibacter cremeus]|uniref:Thiosulfate/3-mercaptopyruvate sulfurtransferase n=1 Tax=Janibacter cremeus TaxID=1285192 RepID=A0A852VZ08_9MICO|nr:sulfurtransferase [Janibacter cremeus]NYF99434.1 thiosulfate/3-mercaptopyruvate sulfurtransferase [Janibacter cremeus]